MILYAMTMILTLETIIGNLLLYKSRIEEFLHQLKESKMSDIETNAPRPEKKWAYQLNLTQEEFFELLDMLFVKVSHEEHPLIGDIYGRLSSGDVIRLDQG